MGSAVKRTGLIATGVKRCSGLVAPPDNAKELPCSSAVASFNVARLSVSQMSLRLVLLLLLLLL